MSFSCHILIKKCLLGENWGKGNVYICTGLVTSCRNYFYHCDMSLWSISKRMWGLIVGQAILALLQEEFLLVAIKKDCAGQWKLLTAPIKRVQVTVFIHRPLIKKSINVFKYFFPALISKNRLGNLPLTLMSKEVLGNHLALIFINSKI